MQARQRYQPILKFSLSVLCWWGFFVSPSKAQNNSEPKVDFARDIQPILSHHCSACHGPDEKSRKAELRLDVREVALSKKVIVPGNAKASKLIARIESADDAEQMPPADSKKPLNPRQKQLLKAWIEQGGKYSQHWAFVAPQLPAIPEVKNTKWSRNGIDPFVLHRLEREGMKPSLEADKATLLRRVTLDLTGLPPTLPELDHFLADQSPNAYEKVVDQLLSSPRYAERMALAWLDAARYADTNGFNNDEDRTQWPWRDWVIDAFQNNMPYDQFIVEQLAGDLLPNATLSQKTATGFHRNQVHNTEGGIIPEEYRVEYVADRVHTTATIFLGLSMQCAALPRSQVRSHHTARVLPVFRLLQQPLRQAGRFFQFRRSGAFHSRAVQAATSPSRKAGTSARRAGTTDPEIRIGR